MMNQTFQALSDPTRRKIVQMLQERDLTAGEIADAFNISKPSVSHHLSILKNAEVVIAERDGQFIIYSLNASVIQEFLQEVMEFFHVGKVKEKNDEDSTA